MKTNVCIVEDEASGLKEDEDRINTLMEQGKITNYQTTIPKDQNPKPSKVK